ncbi:MAG: hypothetical protein RL367_2182 [Pseudomonadota bacterium]|jgi:putative transcriptional regulator
MRVHYFPSETVQDIREKTGISQGEFSAPIGVSTATLCDWEQGRGKPDRSAQVLFAMLARDPKGCHQDVLALGA